MKKDKNKEENEVKKDSKLRKWLKPTKKKVIIGIILLLILLKIFTGKNNETTAGEKVEIAEITRRDIATSVSATGTLEAVTSQEITGGSLGMKVKTVNVKKGDHVNAGDIICTFDTTDLQKSLNDAQRSLADVQASTNNDINNTNNTLNNAKNAEMNSLRSQINQMNSSISVAEIPLRNAQDAEKAAKTNYDTAVGNVNAKKEARDAAQKALDDYKAQQPVGNISVDNTVGPNIEDEVGKQLQLALDNANRDLADAEGIANNAKTAYQTAKDATTGYKATRDQLVESRNQLTNSLNALSAQNTTINPNTGNLAVDSLETQVSNLRRQINDSIVRTPVSGTVTSVGVKVGEMYTSQTIAKIEDCDAFVVSSEINEYDIPDIDEGMKVIMKTDATRDLEMNGTVREVSSTATGSEGAGSASGIMSLMMGGAASLSTSSFSSGSSATYNVKISVDTPSDRLRQGMNARLSIITEQRDNVLSVPYEAVLERDDGTKYIQILKNEYFDTLKTDKKKKDTEEPEEIKEALLKDVEPYLEEVDVKVGIEGAYYTEISSKDIDEGMKIIVPKGDTANSLEVLINAMGADGGI